MFDWVLNIKIIINKRNLVWKKMVIQPVINSILRFFAFIKN